jgi:spore coat polysaccharide biosynthesis predicted glycosyltransferase SpsG
MDDLQNHAYPVDGVINYNLFADRAVYERLYTGRSVQFCLGENYVPLREQFSGVNYGVRDRVRDVLITTGGGDEHNIAGAILDRIYREDMVYHVLVGRFSPHFESWQKRAGAEKNIRIHFDVKDMAELMCQCDLAVSAGGSTLYELAAVGVPFISFSYAENQEALVEYMGRHEVAGCAGAWHKDARGTLDRLGKLFAELCEESDLRRRYFERERGLIDGQGAGRVAKVLCHVHCGNIL